MVTVDGKRTALAPSQFSPAFSLQPVLRMNYFAHGRALINDPYFLAGTAVPDWLGVVDRRVRVRSALAEPHLASDDPRLARVAAGIVQHCRDDAWFHATRAFTELSLALTV